VEELRQEMSYEEFRVYPRRLGWKYEYFADALHLSPSWTAVAKFRLSLDNLHVLSQHAESQRCENASIRAVTHADLDALRWLFCECFADAIDYAGSDAAELTHYAHKSLDSFFGPSPPDTVGTCRVAIEADQIVGCCMIDRCKLGLILQPIFVAPSHQRQGLATKLLYDTVQSFASRAETKLYSRCNLGNDASMAWHLCCGFIEEPSPWAAGHRANIYWQEAERHELLGLPTAAAMRELADRWADERERLEAEGAFEEF
jgi:GNAT superfamily N-acetyltransferase